MSKPKMAIVGYGSMGKEIDRLARENEIEVTNIFDVDKPFESDKDYDFDVAIEFTEPSSAIKNVRNIAEAGKNIVLGTTGWYENYDEIKEIIEKNNVGLVWASNFSVGMNIFFKIIGFASELINKTDDYDIMLHELHHKRKKDSPSGTAESLAKIILERVSTKSEAFKETAHEQIKQEQLHVTSTRGGEIFGTHTVYIDSLADTLELTHRARSREGFALGSLKAAELIHGKKGMYEFPELLF